MTGDVFQIVLGALQGLGASTVFILVLFIGFCVSVGFTKLKKTAGGAAPSSRAWTSASPSSRWRIFRRPLREGPPISFDRQSWWSDRPRKTGRRAAFNPPAQPWVGGYRVSALL